MRESAPVVVRQSTEIGGNPVPATEQKFQTALFGQVARLIWKKPDTVIAEIAGVSDRQARDYLAGRVPAPAIVIAAIIVEITKRS